MNVFVLTDMEGISGISDISMVMNVGTPEHYKGLKRLMADTNAAVAAAFDAGAEKVYVADGHGGGRNFIEGELDPRAIQVRTKDMPQVIKDVQAVVAIGMHAMAGTMNAFLDHTQWSLGMHHYLYNGQRIGELMQMAAFAGYFDVPIVALTGDRAACAEAKRFLGDGLPTACLKEAKERNVCTCMPSADAERLVYETVKKGVSEYERFSPLKVSLPLEITVEFNRSDYCDDAMRGRSDIERLDAYTLRSVKSEIIDYYSVLL